MTGDGNEATVPIELLIEAASNWTESPPTIPIVSLVRFISGRNKRIYLEYILFFTSSITSITYLYKTRTI